MVGRWEVGLDLQTRRPGVDHIRVTATSTRPPAGPTAPSRGPAEVHERDPGQYRGLLVAVFLVAAVISAVTIHAHAMWFDELQAWNIARASHSLGDLFSHLRYEGHPPLWYLPLYGITRFTGDPRAMQVLAWLVVVVVDALVLFRSPFPVPARIALVAGYFFAFEYSVMARSYGLGVLLLVVALLAVGRVRPHWTGATIALALLAWTSLAGAVLAGSLALVLAWRWWRARRGGTACRGGLTCALVTAGSAGLAAFTCIPPSDFHSFSVGIPNSTSAYLEPTRLAAALGGTWRGLVPIPVGVGRWNTNIVDQLGGVWLQVVISVALVVLVARVLRPYATAFALWIVGTIAYVLFSVVVVLPDRAHYAGEFFLLFVACAWLAYSEPDGGPTVSASWRSGLPAVLVVVLAAQIVATLAILPDATARPFAPDRTLAEAAVDTGLARDVVSGQDFDGATIAGYLDVPVYSIARHAPMRFFLNDDREAIGNEGLTPARLVCEGATVAQRRRRPVALVVDKRLPTPRGVHLRASSQGVHLYRIAPAADVAVECAR
jgi:hypothetical protein